MVVNLKRQNLSVLFEKEDQNGVADSNADSLAFEDMKEGEVEEITSVEANKKKSAPKSNAKPKQKGQQAAKKPASKPVVEKEIAKPTLDADKNESESEDENSNDESNSKSKKVLTFECLIKFSNIFLV